MPLHGLPSTDPNVIPGAVFSGFELESIESVPEISGEALVFTHKPTGLRLLWLANDDVERSFSISFKTPPADDTGVFHILEHSVLDGSARYPVKEPFVELLKTSMATFLNAFTFPDKTMYPVATTNVDDLENLIDVYFDAVFHPDLHRRPEIFEQEGWHLELEGADAPLKRNGVVLNEMRGALSDPSDVLYLGVKQALFPDTCYRFESGGDPAAIPSLTYEAYCDAHRRHYRPENAHAVFYGDLDLERELAFLDEHLAALDLEGAGEPNPLALQRPTGWTSAVKTMATSPENASVAVGLVFATSSDRERILAADIILDALAGSNEAPLKRAVLQSGLGKDLICYVVDGCAQPFLLFELKGAEAGAAKPFRELLVESLTGFADEGIPRERLEAALAGAEFALREGESSYPLGIAHAMASLASWLYDEADPLSYLRYEEALADLKEGLETGLYEELLGEFLACDHACVVELRPEGDGALASEDAELAALKATLTDAQVAEIVAETKRLHELQAAPDTPEALATLPRLTPDEIGDAPADPELEPVSGAPLLVADLETHGIDYLVYDFDLEGTDASELPLLSILSELLGKLPTKRHTADELDTLVESKLGDLAFAVDATPLWHRAERAKTNFATFCAVLPENVDALIELTREIWLETNFYEPERILAILSQRKLSMEQAMVSGGHAVALTRTAMRTSLAARISQATAGIEFYRWLGELIEHFDERFDALAAKLASLAKRVFTADRLTVVACGPDARTFWEKDPVAGLPASSPRTGSLAIEPPATDVEAYYVPAGVAYVALGGGFEDASLGGSGCVSVAARALTYDYLWREVRVLGGAYGSGCRAGGGEVCGFYSFRDPAVDPTLERYRASARWLAETPLSAEDVDGYIVACIGSVDKPLRARAMLRRLDVARIAEEPADARALHRAEILATTPEQLRALAEPLERLIAKAGICCLGERSLIEASSVGAVAEPLINGGTGGDDDAGHDEIGWRQARRTHPRLLG